MLYVPRHRLPAVAIVLWPDLHTPLLVSRLPCLHRRPSCPCLPLTLLSPDTRPLCSVLPCSLDMSASKSENGDAHRLDPELAVSCLLAACARLRLLLSLLLRLLNRLPHPFAPVSPIAAAPVSSCSRTSPHLLRRTPAARLIF